jgi:tetratricopeptide (TPR) repeat protein
MKNIQSFSKRLAQVARLRRNEEYDSAFVEVEKMLKAWPGNPRLHIEWATLVQLMEEPKQSLQAAKESLRQAIDFDAESPSAAIELAHFLDNVEDSPKAAAKVFAEAVALARSSLIQGLIGQAKALIQLDQRDEARKCLVELLSLSEGTTVSGDLSNGAMPDIILRSRQGQVSSLHLKGPFADEIEELANEVLLNRSA